MAAPNWFDSKAYFNNKLAQLNGGLPGTGTSAWNSLTLKTAFENAGYSTDAEGLYRHFLDFGNAEGVSPNGYFNNSEYLYNKAVDYYNTASVTPQMVESMRLAISDAGMSPWDHYDRYWAESYASEGVFNNPSSSFDVAKYMNDKLAQMQASEPGAGWDMLKLIQAFQDAGLSPVEHYERFGASEGLSVSPVGGGVSGNTFQLTDVSNDALYGTTGDDFFNAELGTLVDGDYIDGRGGNDTLHARLAAGDAIEPQIVNVENVLFQVQRHAAGDGDNLTQANFDAQRVYLADGQTLTLGSVNSRASLSIEDVRHDSSETVIRFADTDPGDVDFDVYFDSQHLVSVGASSTATLSVSLIDPNDTAGDPLNDNVYDTLTFNVDGAQKTIKFDLVNGEAATYEQLAAAINTALQADDTLKGITATVSTDGSMPSAWGAGGNQVFGKWIVLSWAGHELDTTGIGHVWDASGGVPGTSDVATRIGGASTSECPLIQTTIELDNVGRVQWDDASPECLPDDIIYGSQAGDLTVGSMANRGGVERFDVKVDEGSWLSALQSTNEALRMVTVEGKDIDGDGAFGGNLYIGDWGGQGDQMGDNDIDTWTDAARLLTADPTKVDSAGLIDVAVFDASGYKGDINIAAEITSSSFDKYFKSVDGEKYIDKMHAPLASDKYSGEFSYFTGDGEDVVNMTVNGAIAADVDFKMNINTGAADDLVAFRYADMRPNQSLNQKNLENVTINTGSGDDTVWFFGDQGGSAHILAGDGNDVIYANQNETYTGGVTSGGSIAHNSYNAVFVFNTNDKSIVATGLAGATLANDMAIGKQSFAVTGATAGETLNVTVNFKGIEAVWKIADVTDGLASVSAEDINHAIINAIANDPALSELLSAKDGAGHTLLIESIINGEMDLNDLRIGFESLKADGTIGTTVLDVTGGWYDTSFGTDGTNDYDGNNTTTSQVIVNAGAGNDLIVLGPNGGLTDIVELGGAFGNDLLVGFKSDSDKINLDGILAGSKALVTTAGAGALTDNAAAILLTANAAADDGIFTQAEIQALVENNTLGFATAADNGAKGVVFLRDVNAEGVYVYTVVQLTKGSATGFNIMGSLTLDQADGVNSEILLNNLTLDSVLQDSVVGTTYNTAFYNAFTPTTPATLDGTILADTFNELSAANLTDANGASITTVNGLEGNDVFNAVGDLTGVTLDGGDGNDIFNVKDTAEAVTGGTILGGEGVDTLNIDAKADRGVVLNFAGLEKVVVTHDEAVTPTQAVALTVTGATDGLTITGTTKDADTLTINSTTAGDNVVLNSLDMNALNTFTLTKVDGDLAINAVTTAGAGLTIDGSGSKVTGTMYVNGAGAADTLTLLAGDDAATFIGGAAADKFTGGAENDTFTGGEGADIFNIVTVATGGIDTITDYAAGTDKVEFGGSTAYSGTINDGSTKDMSAFNTVDQYLATLTTTELVANGAHFFMFNGEGYLVLDGGTAGYSASEDAVVKLTGISATANITIGDFSHA